MKKLLIFLMALALLIPLTASAERTFTPRVLPLPRAAGDIAAFQGQLYLINDEGLATLAPGEDQPRILIPASAFQALGMDSHSTTSLVTSLDRLFTVTMGEGDFTLHQLTLSTDAPTAQKALTLSGDWPRHMTLFGDTLCYMLRDTAMMTDLKTGETQTLAEEGVQALCAIGPGKALGIRIVKDLDRTHTDLFELVPGDKPGPVLASVDQPLYSPSARWDAENQRLIIGTGRGLYVWDGGDTLRLAGTAPRGDVVGLAAIGDIGMILVDGDILAMLSLTGAAQASLTIADAMSRGGDYLAFYKKHPDIALSFADRPFDGEDKAFVNDMLTKNPDIDLYVLREPALLEAIKAKGYAVDMAQDADIKAVYEGMYAPFRQAFGDDKGIWAMPKDLFINIPAAILPAFEALKIPIPTTYEEYFTLCRDWYKNPPEGHEDYQLDPFDNGMDLASVLTAIGYGQMVNGGERRYDAPVVKRLLALMHEVAQLQKQAPESTGGSHLFNPYYLPALWEKAQYMPLTLEKGDKPVFMVGGDDIAYFVINPYGAHQKEALALVNALTTQMNVMYRGILFENLTTPIENPQFEEEQARHQKRIAEAKEALSKAAEADKQAAQDEVAMWEGIAKEHAETARYQYDQAAIDRCHQYAPQAVVPIDDPIHKIALQYPDLLEELRENPGFDVDSFVNRLNEMLKLIALEN